MELGSKVIESDTEVRSAMEIMTAIKRSTLNFNLCRNRIWAVAANLPDRERKLPLLIPAKIQNPKGHIGHDKCTFDFCEHSRLDFTSVERRHELISCEKEPCDPLQD